MITTSDVVSVSSRQCVALASISSGSLSNTRLPSSPGIRNAQVRSRRSLVLSQDKIGYANIFFKIIFVLQVAKSKARSSVDFHRAMGQKRNVARTRLVPRHRRARIRLSETCVQRLGSTKNTSDKRAHECYARADTCFRSRPLPARDDRCHPGNTRRVSEICPLQTGHVLLSAAHVAQHTRCRHGMNSTSICRSKQTLQSMDVVGVNWSLSGGPRARFAAGCCCSSGTVSLAAAAASRLKTYCWKSSKGWLGSKSSQHHSAYSGWSRWMSE